MGTYASLLNLGRPKKHEPTVVEVDETSVDAQPVQLSIPVAPSPPLLTQGDQSESVGESPRRPDLSPPRRRLGRAAFDIYEDQIQAIKRLKNQRQLDLDRDVSKSEIVREALELFFKSLS